MSDEPPTDTDIVEFIPREEYEQNLQGIENERTTGGVAPILTRKAVTANLLSAFEMAGGVSRLADMLQNDEDRFFAFAMGPYARLAPSAQHDSGGGDKVVIQHVIPRSALDE